MIESRCRADVKSDLFQAKCQSFNCHNAPLLFQNIIMGGSSERKNVGDEGIRLRLEAARKRKEEASREKTAKRHANHNAKRRPATSKNVSTAPPKKGSNSQKGSGTRAISPPKTSRYQRSYKQGVAGKGVAEKKDTALTPEIGESVIRQRLSKKKTAEVNDKKNNTANRHKKHDAKRRVPKSAKKRKQSTKHEVAHQKRQREDEDKMQFESIIDGCNDSTPGVPHVYYDSRHGVCNQEDTFHVRAGPVPVTQEEDECPDTTLNIGRLSNTLHIPGLNNPGQICYANVCIHMCYRDPFFKRAILDMPTSDVDLISFIAKKGIEGHDSIFTKMSLLDVSIIPEEQRSSQTIAKFLLELRNVFIELETSHERSIDSFGVLRALHIDLHTQQCANEFWKNIIEFVYDLFGLRNLVSLLIQEDHDGALKYDALLLTDVRRLSDLEVNTLTHQSISVDVTGGR